MRRWSAALALLLAVCLDCELGSIHNETWPTECMLCTVSVCSRICSLARRTLAQTVSLFSADGRAGMVRAPGLHRLLIFAPASAIPCPQVGLLEHVRAGTPAQAGSCCKVRSRCVLGRVTPCVALGDPSAAYGWQVGGLGSRLAAAHLSLGAPRWRVCSSPSPAYGCHISCQHHPPPLPPR